MTMKRTITCVGFLIFTSIGLKPLVAQSNATGIWQVNGEGPSFPWTLTLKVEGKKVTGTVRNCASNRGSSELSEGLIEGDAIRLKCTSDDGNRTLTLVGAIHGDEIDFTWQKEVKPGASPNPRDGMFGVAAPPRFTAKRISNETRPTPSAASTTLQNLLGKHDYPEFARALQDATGLWQEERLYFQGMLAYLQGRFSEAVQPLVSAVNTVDSSLTSYQVEQALETLGDNAAKSFRYEDAVAKYDLVDKVFGARMGEAINPVREKRAVAAGLEGTPAQTVQTSGDFELKRMGIEYPISVGGKEFSAIFDTGAAFSIISESAAKNWDVKAKDGAVTFHGYGAGTFSARPAVIPVLQIGKAELRNVAVFVTDDKNIILSRAILGYPVISALGRITFGKDGSFRVHPETQGTANSAPLWVSYSSLLVSVSTGGGSASRVFILDTGSLSTFLTNRYLDEHRSDFTGKPIEEARLAGIDGIQSIPAYSANALPLWFGSAKAALNGQHIFVESQGGDAQNYFGVVGQDVLQQFSSYTIDFRAMRFSAVP